MSYLLFPSHQLKSQAMIVEPYNFTLSYNGLVRTCSIIVNFSNEQTHHYLSRYAPHELLGSAYRSDFSVLNKQLSQVYGSLFNQEEKETA